MIETHLSIIIGIQDFLGNFMKYYIIHLSFCVFLFICSSCNYHKYFLVHTIPVDLIRNLESSPDSLRVSWNDFVISWEWHTLIYDIDSNGVVLGANLINYNEVLNTKDTLRIDSSLLLSESYSLLKKNIKFYSIKHSTNSIFDSKIYIAKKGKIEENEVVYIDGDDDENYRIKKEMEKKSILSDKLDVPEDEIEGNSSIDVIRTWDCQISLFPECQELRDVLHKIYRPYTNQIPYYLTKNLESSSDSLRMTWFNAIGWYWHTLLYDMDDNGIVSGVRLSRYNEALIVKDTLQVDSTALASEVYNLISKIDIANLSPVTSNKILWEEGDAPMVYFAKKGIDTVQHCDVKKFPECAKLADLLYRIYPHPSKYKMKLQE